MLNKTINQLYTDADFIKFIYSSFMNEVDNKIFSEKYKMRNMPKEVLEAMENKSEAKRILERELIRDNIYLKYKFDIFENPIIVFYEDERAKKMKPFQKYDEADSFSQSLLNKGIYSMLILMMNHDIECKVYKD